MLNFRLLFLGTCARDFSPKLQNECKNCFDKNARRASCALLCDHILIDAGPHVLDSLRIAGIERESITDIIITHLHADHFCPENIAKIAASKRGKLRLYVRDDAEIPEIPNTEIIKMNNFERYNIDGFEVTGLPSNHERDVCPRWLLFEKEGKKLLYATDGAWIVNETYYYLKNAGLDVLVMDCTCGEKTGEYRIAEHNTIPMIRLLLASYKTMGIINEQTKIYATHIAPSLHKPHDEIQEGFKNDKVTVAYDGLKIKL
jgi:phosphoribosyl 1,2-cyclic phosphate phosphodiesterase